MRKEIPNSTYYSSFMNVRDKDESNEVMEIRYETACFPSCGKLFQLSTFIYIENEVSQPPRVIHRYFTNTKELKLGAEAQTN
jgi:hypothetical protein